MPDLSAPRSAALTAVAVALLGAPVGLLWAALAPRPAVVIVAGGADYANPEANTFFAADGYFLLITVAVGAICGILAHRLRALQPEGALAGLVAGGVGGAVVAAQVGERVHRAAFLQALSHAVLGASLHTYVMVRADGVLLGWPLAAVIGYAALVALTPAAPGQPPPPPEDNAP